jgi:hypothetical protein
MDAIQSLFPNIPDEIKEKQRDEILGRDKRAAHMQGVATNFGLGLLWTVLTLLALFGAFRMRALRSYGLAMTSAVITLIPCATCCPLLGQIAGIWAIIVLLSPAVKAAFR